MSVVESARSSLLTRPETAASLKSSSSTPFHLQPNYLTLTRTLSRLCATLLPLPSAPTSSLSPYQQQIRSLLLSPLPYQRTKYLRTIDNARTILLDLERGAQTIKIQRTKRETLKDLAEKRRMIRELRSAVEELGRQVDGQSRDGQTFSREPPGETVEELLGLPRRAEDQTKDQPPVLSDPDPQTSTAQSPPSAAPTQPHLATPAARTSSSDERSALLGLRNRHTPSSSSSNQPPSPASPQPAPAPGPGLTPAQESLTSSLLTLSRQLKAQSLHLSQTLQSTDAAHVSHATTALDRSSQLLEVAGRGMGSLKRMSEGEGWWGRMMLYAWIAGLWVAVLGLVGVGPKLRF